jgi:hypothetical protein
LPELPAAFFYPWFWHFARNGALKPNENKAFFDVLTQGKFISDAKISST